jgi:16S rRNA processing protein RimM
VCFPYHVNERPDSSDDFFYLGKIIKTYGKEGHVIIHLDVDDPSRYKKLKSVYLDLHGERIPFFLESLELKHNGKALALFQDYENLEDAEVLPGLRIYLPADQLPPLKGKKFYFHEVTGFEVVDAVHGPVGIVESVIDLPHQSLLQVRHGEKEILIPVVDAIIRKVDRRQRKIRIEAPPGLIEIYL